MTSKWFKVAAAAALCVASAAASAQAIKLWQVTSGYIELDKGFLTAMSGVGTKVNAPVTMHIIQHPRGLIVFDTGVNVATADGQCVGSAAPQCLRPVLGRRPGAAGEPVGREFVE